MNRPSSDAILNATLKLIIEGGMDAVRYRDVARESGIALGTISYQFPSREALIRSAFQFYLASSENVLCETAARARIREPRDVAKLIADVLQAEFARPDRAYLAEYELLVYAARDPQMAEVLAAWDRRVTAELGAILESVGIQTPFATAETLLELARGFQLVRLGQKKPNFADLGTRIERVLRGFSSSGGDASVPASASAKKRRS
jgi:DNA-binding transcriptional regulator YbjK